MVHPPTVQCVLYRTHNVRRNVQRGGKERCGRGIEQEAALLLSLLQLLLSRTVCEGECGYRCDCYFYTVMRPLNPRPPTPPYYKAAGDAAYPNRLRGSYRVCNRDSNPVVVKRTVNRNVGNDRKGLCVFFFEKLTRQAKTKTENNKYRNRTSKHVAFAYCVRHIKKKKKTLTHWIPGFNYTTPI